MIVSSENDNYKAEFGFDNGVPPDNALGDFSGQAFSTHDNDNDQSESNNCADKCGAGFWYNNCDTGSEMGTINQASSSVCGGFSWDKTGPRIELKETKLFLLCGGDDDDEWAQAYVCGLPRYIFRFRI